MKISEFTRQFPEYAIDFDIQLRNQPRIYDGAMLDRVPVELEPEHPYWPGSRGRPNLNQTLAHSQCARCHRVLRNDFYYTLPSMMRRNMVFSHCRACHRANNAARYETRADIVRARREAIWRFLAPQCVRCGFKEHLSALELHHLQHKESTVNELITHVTLTVEAGRVEALLREAMRCIPLCSNCHRMLHAGAIALPATNTKPTYTIAGLLKALNDIK